MVQKNVSLQADGKILVGGDFTALSGQTRNYIGRLSSNTAALQQLRLDPGGTIVSWARSGASPEVGRITFELSWDNITLLGVGERIASGWQLSGFWLPFLRDIWIRAGGYYEGSVLESVRYAYFKANATTTMTSSANPSVYGQGVIYTAAVVGVSPTGTVTFQGGGVNVAGCSSFALSGGSATCGVTLPSVGAHSITTSYGGDTNNNPSLGSLAQTVNKANTTVSLASSSSSSVYGQTVIFTATLNVTAPGGGTPTGSFTFSELLGAGSAGQRPAGSAGGPSWSTTALTVGTHTIFVHYSGDGERCRGASDAGRRHVQWGELCDQPVGIHAIPAPDPPLKCRYCFNAGRCDLVEVSVQHIKRSSAPRHFNVPHAK